MTDISVRFRLRRGTAANLASVNEVPLLGELVVATDTNQAKLGDGTTAYNSLPLFDLGLRAIASTWAALQTFSAGIVIGVSGPRILSGTGTPEGAVTAGKGSLFLRTDGGAGTTLYVKETGAGNTGWAAK